MEAEIVQQQAPSSYGQLIAQGAIPPACEDFPTEKPNPNSVLGNLLSFRSCAKIRLQEGLQEATIASGAFQGIIWLIFSVIGDCFLKLITRLGSQRPNHSSQHLLLPQRPCITAQVKI